jgi:sodium-dependent phosphate transporter
VARATQYTFAPAAAREHVNPPHLHCARRSARAHAYRCAALVHIGLLRNLLPRFGVWRSCERRRTSDISSFSRSRSRATATATATAAPRARRPAGTSVGSRTLTLKQAVLIAIVFEFTGALVLGRVISDTISGGIADIAVFVHEPEFFAYGMVVALFVGGVWQIVASYFEFNVSATHSIVGAIIGFAIVYGGPDAVLWAQNVPRVPGERRPFPPVKGVVPIVLSWFVSPVLTGAVSALLFSACRTLVLRRRNSFRASFFVLPPLVMLTVWINVFFVLTKGATKTLKTTASNWTDHKAAWVSAIVAACCTVLAAAVVAPLLWARINALEKRADAARSATTTLEMAEAAATSVAVPEGSPSEAAADAAHAAAVARHIGLPPPPRNKLELLLRRGLRLSGDGVHSLQRAAMHGLEVDIHKIVDEDPIVAAIHANAEVFDPKAESVFAYLQVFSAICVIFAHGAAEVGYMTGPLGAVWQVVSTGALSKKVSSPLWVVLLSACGLVFGLATYGCVARADAAPRTLKNTGCKTRH